MTLPTTVTLVNQSSATTQPPGVPTQTFGQPFKQGDVPAGSVPVFTAGGVTQPYSTGPYDNSGNWLPARWPDGSLKFAVFMLRPTFSLAPSASQTVTITAVVGSPPAASARTLTEVYAQNLVVNAPPYSSSYNGRSSSTLGSWLTNDSNNYKQNVWLDGAAGKAWKISTNMAVTQGAAKDGMLTCDHYIVALNNASGGLGGYRWLGMIRQPFYNASGAPASKFVFFEPPNTGSPTSGINWSVNGTATPLQYYLTPQTFTVSTTGQTATIAAGNNWYTGGQIQGNVIPCIVTGSSLPTATGALGGTSPSAIADGAIVFALMGIPEYNPSLTNISLSPYSGVSAGVYYNFTSTGSGTLTPTVGVWSGTKLPFANADGKYNFFAGTGTGISAETTLRAQINLTYWQSTRLIPPYDVTLGPSEIPDVTTSYDWHPYNVADFFQDQGAVGDHPDIGMLPNLAIVDLYNQSFASEKVNRIIGLSHTQQTFDLVDATLDAPINASLATTYTGMPAPGYSAGWPASALNVPPGWGSIVYSTNGSEHEPNYSYWVYLRTGELQFLDSMVLNAVFEPAASFGFPNPTPTTAGTTNSYDRIVTWFNLSGAEQRSMAWANRDIQLAALIYPWNAANPTGLDFAGTQIGKYLNDQADNNAKFPMDQFSNTTNYPSYAQANGLWLPWINDNYPSTFAVFGQNYTEWEFADFSSAMGTAEVRNPGITNGFLESITAKRWQRYGSNGGSSANGYWELFGYEYGMGNYFTGAQGFTNDANWWMESIAQDAAHYTGIVTINFLGLPPALTWTPNAGGGGQAFTITPVNPAIGANGRGFIPTNGDKWMIGGAISVDNTSPYSWPPELSFNTPYYAVGVTATAIGGGNYTYTFDLATTMGGSPIAISSTGNPPSGGTATMYVVPYAPPITNWPYAFQYLLNLWQACCIGYALGVSGFNTVPSGADKGLIDDNNYRITNTGGGPYTRYFDLPSGYLTTVDGRYATQTTWADNGGGGVQTSQSVVWQYAAIFAQLLALAVMSGLNIISEKRHGDTIDGDFCFVRRAGVRQRHHLDIGRRRQSRGPGLRLRDPLRQPRRTERRG